MRRLNSIVRHLTPAPCHSQDAAAASSATSAGTCVAATEGTGAVVWTLSNAPKRNALSLAMVHELAQHVAALHGASTNERPHVVLLAGDPATKGVFCSGGDVRSLVHDIMANGEQGAAAAMRFFRSEFELIADLAQLPVPMVALWNGLVLGGGVGVSLVAPYRVATELTRFGMPETLIGFFPDVGVTLALAQLSRPGMGMYLALTGDTIGAADALWLGLATHFVASAQLPALRTALGRLRASSELDTLLRRHAMPLPAEPVDRQRTSLRANASVIEQCFAAANSVGDIVARLERAAASDVFAQRALDMLRLRSPTALAVTLRAMLSAPRERTLVGVLARDLRLCAAFVRFPDFVEGIRASLIDKTNKPQWAPVPADVDSWGTTVTADDAAFAPLSRPPVANDSLSRRHRQIFNTWQDLEGFNCFGCAPPTGGGGATLALAVFVPLVPNDLYDVVSEHVPQLSGFPRIAHGGLLATLIDEMAYFAFNQTQQTVGMTGSLSVKYARPVQLQSWVSVEAKAGPTRAGVDGSAPHVTVAVRVLQGGKVCASGTVDYVLPPIKLASAALGMPEHVLKRYIH